MRFQSFQRFLVFYQLVKSLKTFANLILYHYHLNASSFCCYYLYFLIIYFYSLGTSQAADFANWATCCILAKSTPPIFGHVSTRWWHHLLFVSAAPIMLFILRTRFLLKSGQFGYFIASFGYFESSNAWNITLAGYIK